MIGLTIHIATIVPHVDYVIRNFNATLLLLLLLFFLSLLQRLSFNHLHVAETTKITPNVRCGDKNEFGNKKS